MLYVPHVAQMCHLFLLLPVPEEYLLPFPPVPREWLFASRNMTVSSRVWLLEREDFRRVIFKLFPFTFLFSAKDGCGMYFVLCITSVDLICSVP